MPISIKNHEETIYAAIYEPIMNLRIKIEMASRKGDTIDIDLELFRLEILIYERVEKALSVSEQIKLYEKEKDNV